MLELDNVHVSASFESMKAQVQGFLMAYSSVDDIDMTPSQLIALVHCEETKSFD